MKTHLITLISLSTIISFASPLYASENATHDEFTKRLINERYNKQTTFTCNKQDFQIPPYFPFSKEFTYNNKKPASNLYLTAQENECGSDYFHVVLGLDADCLGQNICVEGSFSYSKVGVSILENIEGAFSLHEKELELQNNKIGYLIPSKCHTFCSTAKLIWFDYDTQRIYILSTKNPQNSKQVVDELVKAANSYISSQN